MSLAAQYLGGEELAEREITNVTVRASAWGNPVGATGARIMVTLIYAMKKHGKTLGLRPSAAAASVDGLRPSKML